MPFKYQAPLGYKPTNLVIAGHQHDVKDGVLTSEDDIIHILTPLGFERFQEPIEIKKAATKTPAE